MAITDGYYRWLLQMTLLQRLMDSYDAMVDGCGWWYTMAMVMAMVDGYLTVDVLKDGTSIQRLPRVHKKRRKMANCDQLCEWKQRSGAQCIF